MEICDRELAAAGAPAGTQTMPGLTPAELAVARLVAAGRSNRESAAELYVSVKTVEFHPGHIFGKLGIRSRKDLIAPIGRPAALIRAAEAGEIPLLVAVFAESTVDTVNQDGGRATDSAIEGPYYKPGAPCLQRPYALPMRPDEPGDPLLFCGRVESDGGAPLAGAAVDLWQSTSDGLYSFFTPQLPEEYVLRGRLRAGAAGEFDVRTIRPVPYQIPREGPVGDLLENILGRHCLEARAPALQDRRRRVPAADHPAVLRR